MAELGPLLQGLSLGYSLIARLDWGKVCSWLFQVQFLGGCWTEGLSSLHQCLEALSSSLPCGPLHRAAHSPAAHFIRVSKEESLLARWESQSQVTSS